MHPIQRQRLSCKNTSKDQQRTKPGADSLAETKIAKTRHVITGILPHDRITSQKQDAFMARSVVFGILRQKRSPAKSQRRVVRKDQLRFCRSFYNLVVCFKIPIRQHLFHGKQDNWDPIMPSGSPKAHGTIYKFGEERFRPEVLSISMNFISVILARRSLRRGPERSLCNMKDAPAKQRGTWRKYLQAQKCGQSHILLSYRSNGNAGAHFKITRGRSFVIDSGA